ncbi:MAG: type II toxin-antitoxin system VapC family toxin, partial [Spirochaetota bacterium]
MNGELAFIDTNVLLAATDRGRPDHEIARSLFSAAIRAGVHLAVSGQVLREYLVVATRPPEANGFGLSPDDALHNVGTFRARTVLVEELEAVMDELFRLLPSAGISDKRIHDANIAATMRAHHITTLVTANVGDFRMFQ